MDEPLLEVREALRRILLLKASDAKDYIQFQSNYSIGCMVGEGRYGRVHLATSNHGKIVRAIKLMKLNQRSLEKKKVLNIAQNELQILSEVDHPNIVRVIEAYKDDHNFVLVTEFC